jgi:SAM-dependent methyltransferase
MPEIYDRCLGPVLFAPYAARLAQLAAMCAPQRVLELAAGTGIATKALVGALPEASITATDINPAMVAWSAARVSGATWLQADAQQLDFADDSFDLVLCQFGVMFFPDKPAAFAETARVLAPSARMLFAVWDAVDASPFPAAMVASLAAVLPVDPPSFITRVPHGYYDPQQITADVTAGGLLVESVDSLVLTGTAPSAAALVEGYCLGSPLRFALEQRGSLDQLLPALTEEMTVRLGAGPVHGDLLALVVSARKPALS